MTTYWCVLPCLLCRFILLYERGWGCVHGQKWNVRNGGQWNKSLRNWRWNETQFGVRPPHSSVILGELSVQHHHHQQSARHDGAQPPDRSGDVGWWTNNVPPTVVAPNVLSAATSSTATTAIDHSPWGVAWAAHFEPDHRTKHDANRQTILDAKLILQQSIRNRMLRITRHAHSSTELIDQIKVNAEHPSHSIPPEPKTKKKPC